jgi:hypothetical protein
VTTMLTKSIPTCQLHTSNIFTSEQLEPTSPAHPSNNYKHVLPLRPSTQIPSMQYPHGFPRQNSDPTERSALLPPLNTPLALNLRTPPRHPSPVSPLTVLFKRYEQTLGLANTLLAAMQETYYRIVPHPFDEQLLGRIEVLRPQLLSAMGRFVKVKRRHKHSCSGGLTENEEFERVLEGETAELEGLLGKAKEIFSGK